MPPSSRAILFGVLSSSLACGGAKAIDYGDCPDYIACAESVDTPMATIEATYGEDGLCWDGTEDEQVLCRAACTDAMEVLEQAWPDASACSSGGGSSASHYTGGWPSDDACEDLDVTGDAVGDVTAATALEDQFGDLVDIHDFCEHTVLIAIDAEWTGPLSLDDLQDAAEDHPDELVVMLALIEDVDGDEVDDDDVDDLVERYDLEFPVLIDDGDALFDRWGEGYVPLYVLLAPGARVHAFGSFEVLDEVDAVVESGGS